MKSITPVVSIVLLITMTLVAAGGAFFFVNSNVSDLESQGNLENYPGMDNSKLNLVSVTGSKAIVRNDGSSPVTDLVVFINGELLNYTLSEPILPGELREINYNARQSGQDLQVTFIYNSGKTEQDTSPARVNTPESGFTETPYPLNELIPWNDACSGGGVIVNLFDKLVFEESDEFSCSCSNDTNLILNNGFESDLTNWDCMNPSGCSINDSIFHSGSKSAYLNNTILAQTFDGLVTSIDFYAYALPEGFFETNGQASLYIIYDDGTNSKSITYMLNYTSGNSLNCDTYTTGLLAEDSYYDCSYAKSFYNSWNQFSINDIYEGFKSAFPEENLSIYNHSYVMFIMIDSDYSPIDGYLLLDDINAYSAPELKYCNKRNSEGIADGVCFKGECVSVASYGFKTSPNLLSRFENSNFTTYYKSPESVSCQLTAGSNYPMTVNSNNATASVLLSSGGYASTLSCSTNDYSSTVYRTINITNWNITKRLTDNSVYDYYPKTYSSESNVHIVWRDASNSRIYHIKSEDNGSSFSAAQQLSSLSGIQFVSLAGSGNNLHVVWESTSGTYYVNSTDNGDTWSSEYDLLNYTGNTHPNICAENNNVYAVFIKNNDLYFKNSSDNGATWSDENQLTDIVSGKQHPNVAVSGDNIHLIWWDGRDGTSDLFYKNSSDSGITWSSDYKIFTNSSPYQNIKILTQDNDVYIFISEFNNRTISFAKSTNNGTTWSDFTNIVYSGGVMEMDAVLLENKLYLVYSIDQGSSKNILFIQSNDGGATWTYPLKLLPDNSLSVWPTIAVSNNNIHITWSDRIDNSINEIYYKGYKPGI